MNFIALVNSQKKTVWHYQRLLYLADQSMTNFLQEIERYRAVMWMLTTVVLRWMVATGA